MELRGEIGSGRADEMRIGWISQDNRNSELYENTNKLLQCQAQLFGNAYSTLGQVDDVTGDSFKNKDRIGRGRCDRA